MKVTIFVLHRSICVVKYVSVFLNLACIKPQVSLAMRFNRLEVAEREIFYLLWDMSRSNVSYLIPRGQFS